MAARTAVTAPAFTTESERDVHNRIVRQLGEDCLVLANLRVTSQHKDHEADLVVLMPGSGIVVVEVKGSHVWHDGVHWRQRIPGEDKVIHPVDQARDAMYALRQYVASDPRWGSRTPVRWGHHVVLTGTDLPGDFATPDCPRWQVSGRGELDGLGSRVWDTTSLHRKDAREPTRQDVDLIEEILVGRSLPARDVVAIARDREDAANRLTLEQATLLKVTRLLNRVEVRGGAGSGKTVMACQQAMDLASGRLAEDQRRRRVAVVCYSYGLARFLREKLDRGSRGKRPAFVGTFEDLGRRWGVPISADRKDSDFWENRLPEEMAARAAGLADDQKFDAIIVDEAQDFADSWWVPLLRALRDEEAGGFYVYSDERQRIFPRFGRPPIALVPLVLDHNLRNTQQIGQAFAPLAPRGMELRGGDGPEVTFVECPADEALGVADDWVDELFDEGWGAGDIALITMGARHPVQVERQEELGFAEYWEYFWSGEDIFYSHVLGFKGMERRAVVLCVNARPGAERLAEMLYVGMSRATDRLVVVGDPGHVREIGGPQVAAKLGIR